MRSAVAAFGFVACVAAPATAFAQEGPRDPWEGFNRGMFAVHEAVDQAVVEPVARGYRAVTPEPVRNTVRNFLRNLRSPVTLANDLLQGSPDRAGTTMARLTINSTVGVLGLFDPATGMGFERHEEDFGQTLAVWGVGEGPYIFIPLMGPTNLRDGTGRIIDMAFDPFTWVGGEDFNDVRVARAITTGLVARESVIEVVDDIRRDSLDPYASIRTSYGLLRESAVQNGRAAIEDLPDFDDNFDAPSEPMPTPSPTPAPEDNPQQSNDNQAPAAVTALEQAQFQPTSTSKHGVLK